MSPVRYPSLAYRKQSTKRREAEVRAALRAPAEVPRPLGLFTYADNLQPTVPGYVHGIISIDPYRIQCDGCGDIAEGKPLIILAMSILFVGGDDPRRLCASCREEQQHG